MAKQEKRKSSYAALLGEQEYFIVPFVRSSVSAFLELVGSSPNARAIDIGAGECPLRGVLEHCGYRYTSMDVHQNQAASIDILGRIDRKLPPELGAAKPFDLVVLTEVMEHVPDWKTAFENLGLLVAEGGHCILTTPFFYMLHEEPHDYWRPTIHAIRHFASEAGLEIVCERRCGSGWDVAGTLLCSTSVIRSQKTLLAYLFMAPVWLAHALLKRLTKSRLLRKWAELQTSFYLSNCFLLRKKSATT